MINEEVGAGMGSAGRVAIVTGASAGIGEATARRLHDSGFTVYALARRVERMSHLGAAGIHLVKADVTDDAALTALVDQVIGENGRIDVLVNNAGYGSYGALEEVPLVEARRQFEVNVFALARLTQLVLPHLRRQRSGHIVNISSMGAKFGEPLGAWYHATKYAVEGLSDSLRQELAPFGIHVVIVEPGSIAGEWGMIAADLVEESSSDGPYAEQAAQSAKVLRVAAGDTSRASSPEVVARAVGKAVTSRRPRTRYVVGRGARPLLAARRLLPDRAFDALRDLGFRLSAR